MPTKEHECINQKVIDEMRLELAVAKSEMKNVQSDIVSMSADIKAIRDNIDKVGAWVIGFMATSILTIVGMAITIFLELKK